MIVLKRKPTITELTRIILSSHPGVAVNPTVALQPAMEAQRMEKLIQSEK
jgi:hypothetical protein